MKFSKIALGVLKLAIFSLLVSLVFAFNPLIVFGVLVALSCTVPLPQNSAMGVVLEVWAKYIMERFWKDNSFIKNTYDDSQYVKEGRIVHIPQPGSKPNVVKNRNQFPGVAVRRSDTDVLYSLDEYSTDPTNIPNIDQINLSYNKMDSVLSDHMLILNEAVADDLLVKWASPNSSGSNAAVYKTTGASIINGNPGTITVGAIDGGQVGNRLAFTHRDLKNLMVKFNVTKVPKQDRFILIDDNMYDAFYDSLGETNAKDFSRYADPESGVIGKLHSFSIMTRSSVLVADNTDAIKAVGSAMAADDNLCSLAWQKNAIAHAIGDTKLYQDPNNPLYYGDVQSALIMSGGRVRRADALGVFVVEQGTPVA